MDKKHLCLPTAVCIALKAVHDMRMRSNNLDTLHVNVCVNHSCQHDRTM